MVIGGGGREHALIKKIRENKNVSELYALPGNGGIAQDAVCVPIGAKDIQGAVRFAREKAIDFAVVAPDDPLAMGMVDALNEVGVKCFGPDARAARIESSKVFAKRLMEKYAIPTARYEVYEDEKQALDALENWAYPLVVKADGLALGKGVLICPDKAAAREAVKQIMGERVFGDSGRQIVIEEFLTGPEVSVLAFTDGKTLVPMVSSMDHKRALDGDKGLNTGGMGTIAPNPCYTAGIAERCMREIFMPTVRAMDSEGCPFKGCLYFGLMLTPAGPRVIEYNCRFGDPETQVVLPLLQSDLLDIMLAVADGRLDQADVRFSSGAACCVIVASGGYPQQYQKGYPIDLGQAESMGATVYHSGTALKDGKLVSAGGRVLGVVKTAPTLREAVDGAYQAARQIRFENCYMRNDIGARALAYVSGQE